MSIWLQVDPRSGVPMYVQIIEGVKRALEVGQLRPGDRMPTVQKLSTELTIAPNTIVKAYGELQRQGLIESRGGAGTVVAASAPVNTHTDQVASLYGRLQTIVRDARSLDIGKDELETRFADELAAIYTAQDPQTPPIEKVNE